MANYIGKKWVSGALCDLVSVRSAPGLEKGVVVSLGRAGGYSQHWA